MIKHILLQAVKKMIRGKKNMLITLLGLTLSFITLFHVYSFINYESHFDGSNKNADRIFRVNGDIVAAENTMTHALVGPLLGPGLKEEFPGVEAFVRLIPIKQSVFFEKGKNKYEVEEAYTVDSTIFDVFTLNFIYGSSLTALKNPDEIVINKSLSHKIFGDHNPIGEVLSYNNTDMKIVGVIEDSPANSHHKLNVLFSMGDRWSNLDGVPAMKISEGYWMPSLYTFILLHKNEKIENITHNFDGFYDKHMSPFGKAIHAQFHLVPVSLRDLHFSRNMSYDYPKGNRMYTYIFILIGVFILAIAFINFSNLLVADHYLATRDITIKEILGSGNFLIYVQFLIQSTLIVFISICLALPLYYFSIPFINEFTDIHYSMLVMSNVFLFALILFVVVSVCSSFIPYLLHKKNHLAQNKYRIETKKNGFVRGSGVSVITQFSLCMMLLIIAFFMGRQIDSMVNQDMGFDRENVMLLTVEPNSDVKDFNLQTLKGEILKSPYVSQVAFSNRAPGEILESVHFQIKKENNDVSKIVNAMVIDCDYIPLMNMKMKYGRNFGINFHDEDYKSIIVNEAFIDFCGLEGDITGTKIEGSTIVGVLKDVCFNSLQKGIEPVVFYLDNNQTGYLNIKLKPNVSVSDAMSSILTEWKSFSSDAPFKLEFMDNRVKMIYKDDQTKKRLIQIFMLISYITAIIGLINLSVIMATRRTKEIGVRKVNGARIYEIMKLLNMDFVKWIVIAFLIASPIAWYVLNKWLETFVYKIELSWWYFASTGVSTLLIALFAVSWYSWRAASRNPVEALRYE